MKMPDAVREVLLSCGLCADEWKRLRAAFAAFTPEAPQVAQPDDLPAAAAALVRRAEALLSIAETLVEPCDCTRAASPDEAVRAFIERQIALHPDLSMDKLGRLIHVGKTTLYRKFSKWGFSPNLSSARQIASIARLEVRIEQLTVLLNALRARQGEMK